MATFKERLVSGDVLRTFGLARLVHPVVVDMIAAAGGYDGFWIDAEHAKLTGEQISAVALAARANGFDCFVRMPPTGYWDVTQYLEAGVGGVMAAQIHSATHAREFVSWCRFAPEGTRGLNTGGRDARYTHLPPAEFVTGANRSVFIAIQIETIGALDEVEAIAETDGVDMLFVGPSDLSLALGVVGQFHHDKLWSAIERIAAACREHGKAWGAVVPDPVFARRALDLACQMPTIGNDAHFLRVGVTQMQKNFGEAWE